MTREEMDKILGVDPKNAWVPDYDYDPGYVSDEENEELTQILESLTEDDLQIARTEIVSLKDGRVKEVIEW